MLEAIIHDKPVDRVRAFIKDYAKHLYGIENASALMPLVEIAFNDQARDEHRIPAARELLKYSEVPTRSVEYQGGSVGPDLEVTILGTCEIKEPTLGLKNTDTQSVAPTPTSSGALELHDERREEGS